FVRHEEEDDDDDDAGYGEESEEYEYGSPVTDNWLGPHLNASHGGTLYFVDANATWKPRRDLTLSGEVLLGTTGTSEGRFTWWGTMALANYDINERLRVFARWSYLNDSSGIITGIEQRRHEVSGGVGFTVFRNVELRGEYRHDFSHEAGDQDSL